MTGGWWRVILTRLGGRVEGKSRGGQRRGGWARAAARVLGCALGVALALVASLGQLHLSSALTVPSLTVPSLTVPTVSTPVNTPTVSTPTVTTPTITVPKVTVPTVTVPTVTVPKVTVPKVTVPTPTVSVPRAPSPVHVPTAQTPSASKPSIPSVSTASSSRAAPAAAGSGQTAQPAGGSATAATGGGASGSSAHATGPSLAYASDGAGLAASRAARHHGPLPTKTLRRLVTQLKGCLSSLAPRQTEVLVLRTGIGMRHGFSRQQVAKILGVSARAETRLEQAALGGLARASTHSTCARASSQQLPALLRTAVLLTARAILGLSSALTTPRPAAPVAHAPAAPQSRPASRGQRPARSKAPTPTTAPQVRKAAIPSPAHSSSYWLWLLLLIAAGLVGLWFITARHRARPETAAVPARSSRPRGPRPRARNLLAAVGLLTPPGTAPKGRRQRRQHPKTIVGAGAAETAGAHEQDEALKAFNHGAMLAERDHTAEAEAAFRRADELGHPAAASHLGMLLEERGDLAGAEAAYRRGDARGDAAGDIQARGLLAHRGDCAEAETAYRRADERGHAAAASSLGRCSSNVAT